MRIGGFSANGFLSISSIPLQGLAFPGRSCTLYIQLHDLGSPLGQYICFLLRQLGCPCNFVCQELHNSPCDEPCMVDHFSDMQSLSFNFTLKCLAVNFTARHFPQINVIADSLSRFQMSWFRLLDQMHCHASSVSDPYIFQQSLTMQAA